MLKLTMNPRKRSKRHRAIPHRLRLPSNVPNAMDLDGGSDAKLMLIDNLHAQLHQERSGRYSYTDYLSIAIWQQNVYRFGPAPLVTDDLSRSSLGNNTRIDEYCREQIAEWSFRVVDYFRIDREVVAFSMSFLDRFLASWHCDRSTFKLAATTTLHLAVKLLYPCKLGDLGILSDLSRGEFDMKDMAEMENHILRALKWDLHPPSGIAFACTFLDFFFCSRVVTISNADMDDIYDVASFFTELAICDYFFISIQGSTVALAAILNALEGMFGPENMLAADILHVAREIDLGLHHPDLPTARNRLWELYERSEECALHNDKIVDEDYSGGVLHGGIIIKKVSTALSSPVSVSKPCHSATDFACANSFHCTHEQHPAIRNESW